MFKKIQRIHFVGIGGIGMSGIAELLLNLGYRVSGSDSKLTPLTQRLGSFGARITEGHEAANVAGADVVVVSSAVRSDNPEVAEARRQQIPVIPRAEMLAELMRLKYGIAVAGAHGKTSTTSMVATVLADGGLDPTVVIGGRLNAIGSNAKLGSGDFLVAEADESDGSFLKLSPTIAVVTNIDREHLDYYADLGAIQSAFVSFVNKVPFYGCAVLCLEDPNVQAVLPRIVRRTVTYGTGGQADLEASRIEYRDFGSTCRVRLRGRELGTLRLRVPGFHSVLNSLAAVAVGLELDLSFDRIAGALEGFRNADRRFQVRGEAGEVLVIDDYGHHPTEIVATLSAARQATDRRIVAVFQPHRYTRTRFLRDDFARAFYQADVLIVLPIYAAGEEPIPGVDAEDLVRRVKEYGHRAAVCAASPAEALETLRRTVSPGDLVITLGAGDVWRVGEEYLKRVAAGVLRPDGSGIEA